MLRQLHQRTTASATASTVTTRRVAAARQLLSSTPVRLGVSQVNDDIPISGDSPKPLHSHDWAKRTERLADGEDYTWQLWKKAQLEMGEEWDPYEQFRSLPKPKKVMGNEACHAIWPYPWLLEREVKINLFTKSLYVYYPQHALSESGHVMREIARNFSYEHMVPITFHNAHVYVETEMLVEYGDTPWVVVNCLDGRYKTVPVTPATTGSDAKAGAPVQVQVEHGHKALLEAVLGAAQDLGESVSDRGRVTHELSTRPIQNGFVRVDYMWTGDTIEERNAHLVQWKTEDEMQKPPIKEFTTRVSSWLNIDNEEKPLSPMLATMKQREKRRVKKPKALFSMNSYHLGARNLGTWGGSAGRGATNS